ncbi:hypothetical protein BC830DRAFT_1155025 [Chytriomyces sp. MP71]|nr:hypothetical protein BC830DRAFT_1155025 [Chytriomyces sp. MP71]
MTTTLKRFASGPNAAHPRGFTQSKPLTSSYLKEQRKLTHHVFSQAKETSNTYNNKSHITAFFKRETSMHKDQTAHEQSHRPSSPSVKKTNLHEMVLYLYLKLASQRSLLFSQVYGRGSSSLSSPKRNARALTPIIINILKMYNIDKVTTKSIRKCIPRNI